MKATEPNLKEQKHKKPATHIAGVQHRQQFTIVGRPGVVEAESLEEAINQVSREEVTDGN